MDPDQEESDEKENPCSRTQATLFVTLPCSNSKFCSNIFSHYRGPRGRLDVAYFPVSIPNPSGLYAIKRMPRESHTAFNSS